MKEIKLHVWAKSYGYEDGEIVIESGIDENGYSDSIQQTRFDLHEKATRDALAKGGYVLVPINAHSHAMNAYHALKAGDSGSAMSALESMVNEAQEEE